MNYWTNNVSTLYHADAREIPLPDASVHCVVTSPPYWGLRDYGLGEWEGGDAECGHDVPAEINTRPTAGTERGGDLKGNWRKTWPNNTCGLCGAVQQAAGIGLEPTLGEWVHNLVAVMREVRRVLRDDGTVWLNLGDAYAGGNTAGRNDVARMYEDSKANQALKSVATARHHDLPSKNLMGQPWRVAFALQDDGWILRSAIVWHKPNPMPESAKDRPTSAYEMVFLLAKQARYFYDAEAVRERSITGDTRRPYGSDGAWQMDGRPDAQKHGGQQRDNPTVGANARNVWRIPTQGRPDAHFATFPDELPRRCILAGTSEKGVCGECGAPWARMVEKNEANHEAESGTKYGDQSTAGRLAKLRQSARAKGGEYAQQSKTTGWQPTCACDADVVPAFVLDPFVGSGTTVAVAQGLGRRGVGLDLNREYLCIATKRIEAVTPPFQWGSL